MFLVMKKTHIVLVAIVLVSVFGMMCFSYGANPVTAPGERTVIIDPGHGGEDGGTQGAQEILEKNINLQVAKKLEALLTEQGIKCIMTRTDDVSIHDADKKSIRTKKISDLKNRREIIEKSGAAMFVSIHMNKFEDPQYWGAQVFYSQNNSLSKILAQQTKQALIDVLQDGNKREIKPADSSIYLLKYTFMPAILVECGFLSNLAEEQRLISDEYQQKLAAAIANSVKNWLDNN